jgi:phage baseplate assembly protein gpV
MSAKKLAGATSFDQKVTVAGRQARLDLCADTISVHKNGIEFRSPTPFTEWTEMTVTLHSSLDGGKLSGNGVVVGCAGNRHTGYHVSMIFTGLTTQAREQLDVMARSTFGAS